MPMFVSVFATLALAAAIITIAGAATDFWALAHRHETQPRYNPRRVSEYRRILLGLIGYGSIATFGFTWVAFALIEGALATLTNAAAVGVMVAVFAWAFGERSLRVHAVEVKVATRPKRG